MILQADGEIRSYPCPKCYLCGTEGTPLYHGLNDRLFGTAGQWGLKQCPDPGCGLIWQDPMPLEDDIGKAYHNYYTHIDFKPIHREWIIRLFLIAKHAYLAMNYGYSSGQLLWWERLLGWCVYLHPGRRAVMDFNVMWLPKLEAGRLLDIGCGSGQLLKLMQDLGWQVEGVDFDPDAVENANAKGLHVHLGDLAAQKFAADQFDAVTMSHFIEHVHDPLQLLEECRRILKPGGCMVVVTPNTESVGHTIYREKWMHLDPPRHLHLFNSASLMRVAERAGFRKLELSTSIRDAYGMFMGSRAIQRTGSYSMGTPQPLAVRIWARGMEAIEWIILKLKPHAGEEIVLIAEK